MFFKKYILSPSESCGENKDFKNKIPLSVLKNAGNGNLMLNLVQNKIKVLYFADIDLYKYNIDS